MRQIASSYLLAMTPIFIEKKRPPQPACPVGRYFSGKSIITSYRASFQRFLPSFSPDQTQPLA